MMNPFDWLDKLTGARRSKRNVKRLRATPGTVAIAQSAGVPIKPEPREEDTHTFHLAAPLCMPIRRVYDDLYLRGVRPVHWQWMDVQDRHPKTEELVTVGQMATLTVSNKQANWTEYLLRHLQQRDREGFEIHSKTIDVRNQFHARRRQGKMPTPWVAQGCTPRQR